MQGPPPVPAAPQKTPGFPPQFEPYLLWEFAGLNTRVDRPSIGDQQLAWCDNMMPIDKGQLRALYDIGTAIYTASGALTIVAHYWYVLSDAVARCVVFLSDGSAVSTTLAGVVTTVGAAGTFTSSSIPQVAQYGSQFLCIVTGQNNGYYIWDGTNLYKYGTIGPSAGITDGGSYSTAPGVAVATTGSGTGATFTATVANGSVVALTCTNPGSGFVVGDLVWPVFSGGGGPTSPQATATLSNGVITKATVTSGGFGFFDHTTGAPTAPSVTITDSTGSGANIQAIVSGGAVVELQVTAGGSNYSNPSLSFSGGNGSAAAGEAVTSDGVVTGVTVGVAGSGLSGEVTAAMLDPNGSGAAFTVNLHGGAVASIALGAGVPFIGSGYSNGTLVFAGGGLPSATLDLMPSSINGTDIDTYQTRIWISGGSGTGGIHQNSLVFLSAPGSATDFAASNGGGAFPSTDAFLVSQYTGIKQALGYLYLLGDSSVNYISGVTESGTPPTTTFSNLNVDPTIGTIWPDSLIVYGTTPIFANVFGIHAIIGGTVKKISEPLDGLFLNAPSLTGFIPSSALHTLNGKHVYLFNYLINNPYTGSPQHIIMCWDGARWWTYSPSKQIISLSTLETQSNITAYGTDGTSIYPLFATAGPITKTLKSKLYSEPSILYQKKAWGFYALFGAYHGINPSFSVTIDTEGGSNALTFNTISGSAGSGPYPTVCWAKSAAAQGAGYTMGFTMTSTSNDFVIYQTLLAPQGAYALKT